MKTNYHELDHVYFNIEITPSQSDSGILASYNASLTQQILDNSADYHLVIPVFSIPPGDIPFIYFRIEEGLTQTDPNLGKYIFAIEYNGNVYPTNVEFKPTYTDISVPPAPSENNGVQFDSKYYYLYEMDIFIDLWNKALENSVNNLLISYPALAPLNAPFFIYDKSLNRLQLVCDYKMVTNNITILYNIILLKYLNGIDTYNVSNLYPTTPFQIIPIARPQFYNSWIPPYGTYTDPPDFIYLLSNSEQAQSWGEVKKFLITTNKIPIRPEVSTSYNSDQNINTNLITDFSVPIWNGSRENFFFYSQGVYRFEDLVSQGPISEIQLQVFWEDTTGYIRPLYLYYPDNFFMKLGFIREGFVS